MLRFFDGFYTVIVIVMHIRFMPITMCIIVFDRIICLLGRPERSVPDGLLFYRRCFFFL